MKNTFTGIQDNECAFLSGRFLIKGWCYFIYTCFWWLCYYRLTGCRSILPHTVTLSLIFNFHFYNSVYLLIDPPDGPSLFIYGNTLPFTTNSTFVKIVICQQKYLQSKLSKSVKYTTKIAQRCYIQSCYITDIFTERATHFRLSSGRHMHAWLTYV